MKFYKLQNNKWKQVEYSLELITLDKKWIWLYEDDCINIKGIGLY